MIDKKERFRKDHYLLDAARNCWESWGRFREGRRRNKRYTYGDQWSDIIEVDGERMTEENYIRSQGNIPLKNNLIRRLVRNVLGVFRDQWEIPSWPLHCDDANEKKRCSDWLRNVCESNMLEELFARSLEEFLISGLAVHRIQENPDGSVRNDIVQPDRFFLDPALLDVRGFDASVVGEIHDISFSDLCRIFALDTGDCAILGTLYGLTGGYGGNGAEIDFGFPHGKVSDFLVPAVTGRCRVIEIWRRENVERYICHDPLEGTIFKIEGSDLNAIINAENRRRKSENIPDNKMIRTFWKMEEVWRFYFLAPDGSVLSEGTAPGNSGIHPYIFKAYPFIDGEIHSFVSDIIDQQRYANRLITLYDWVMRASAKGVLLFPQESLPAGVDIDEISNEWSRFNGVILFKANEDVPLPQQVTGNTSNIGITELLNIQLKMLEDISGVNGALQGNVSSNSMSGKLFDKQTQNALTALSDIIKTYGTFVDSAIRRIAEVKSADNPF